MLNKEIEIAAVETKSVVVTANSESFLIRLSSVEGSVVYIVHSLKSPHADRHAGDVSVTDSYCLFLCVSTT